MKMMLLCRKPRQRTTVVSQFMWTTLLVAAFTSVYCFEDGDVKFLEYKGRPSTSDEGVVQVYRKGNWGGICFHDYDSAEFEGRSLCRFLGFKRALWIKNARTAFPNHGNERISVESFVCSDEIPRHLKFCAVGWSFPELWNPPCSNQDVVSIACTNAGPGLSGGNIVGIVMGCVCGVVVILLTVFACKKYRSTGGGNETSAAPRPSPGGTVTLFRVRVIKIIRQVREQYPTETALA